MKLNKIYQELEAIDQVLNIKIIQRKGIFNGVFTLDKKYIIVINKLKTIEQKIMVLTRSFSQFDISKIDIKLSIREIIESEQQIITKIIILI